jgi:PAS domain S-box-containing protein
VETTNPPELESFLGTVPGMIYRSRLTPTYEIDFVSDGMTAITGYPASDFVGPNPIRSLTELMHPDDRERATEAILMAPADGTIIELEYRIRRADGSEAWILSRGRKLVDEDGVLWLHGASVDVTAKHEAEELLRRLELEQIRTAEVEASRARIVEAGYEARRRLERDLHDGAQQRLIVALLTLRRTAKAARDTAAEPLVAETVAHLEEGLAELRRLARGIHPSTLSEAGLARALEALTANSQLSVELSVTSDRLPQSVETAIYFTVAEALTNVAKHARASRARVTVAVADGVATAEIADDGLGGANASGGSGLRGLADRLEAIGGTLEVESPAGGGTVVRARVPLPSGA